MSFRPAENVRNEVALVLGFTAKENGPAEAAIGNASYALLTKAAECLAEEPGRGRPGHRHHGPQRHHGREERSRPGARSLTDRYSLNGFGKALERARKECAS